MFAKKGNYSREHGTNGNGYIVFDTKTSFLARTKKCKLPLYIFSIKKTGNLAEFSRAN